jgi:hypothetical protein
MSNRSFVSDPTFAPLARAWMHEPADNLLGFVWQAYDLMLLQMPTVDTRDVERSITQLLEPRIRSAMNGYEPFYIQHGPFERETMAPPPAQPPAYDLAFVLLADERIMWPLEAKVLDTPGTLAEYEKEIREQYLTCRYAPFSSSGAMMGYLLTGTAADALVRIASKLSVPLEGVTQFATRPHRRSKHQRRVPSGKPYPSEFVCHHLIFEYPFITRGKTLSVPSVN